jgi:hypothetical protein
MDVFYSARSRSRDIPRSPLSVTKYGLTLVLIAAECTLLYYINFGHSLDKYYRADLIASAVKIASYVRIPNERMDYRSLNFERN